MVELGESGLSLTPLLPELPTRRLPIRRDVYVYVLPSGSAGLIILPGWKGLRSASVSTPKGLLRQVAMQPLSSVADRSLVPFRAAARRSATTARQH